MCLPLLAAAVPAALSLATPTVIGGATAGLGAASTIMSYFGQQQAESVNRRSANLNYSQKVGQVSVENARLGAQEAETNLTSAVEAARSFGRISASASALGLGGSTTRQLFGASAAAANRERGINAANYAGRRADLQTELTGASIERSSRIASVMKPSLGSLALGLAGNVLQGATTYSALGGKFGITPAGLTGVGPNGRQAPSGTGMNY